jgi:hypothetical protein
MATACKVVSQPSRARVAARCASIVDLDIPRSLAAALQEPVRTIAFTTASWRGVRSTGGV